MVRVPGEFRLRGKKLSLTYPQCRTRKEDCLQQAKEFFGENLEWIVVAVEAHQDGHPHLHLAIALKNRCDIAGAATLDVIAGKHGNYQLTKRWQKWLAYCVKEYQWIAEGINPKDYEDKANAIFGAVVSGQQRQEVIRQFPEWCANNRRKLDDYYHVQQWLKVKTIAETCWNECEPTDLLCESERSIAGWLNRNIQQERPHKQKQLWVWGPPDHGKSMLLMELDRRLRVMWMQKEEDFMDMWEDGSYDLVVVDEFRGQKKVTFMNEFLEGTPLCLRVKGSQKMKRQNVPVIIMSNGSPKDCYHNMEDQWLEPLYARLTIVQLNKPFRLRFFDPEVENPAEEIN